jgi:UDPglucose 6-dehydrogenase
VVRDFLNPDFHLIGQYDERSGEILRAFYSALIPKAAPACLISIENAEIAKIAVNTYVTTKIVFANMLAEICQCVPGGDVDVVSDILGLDTRIGRKYLTGGLGYGGPCFPRDNAAIAWLADLLDAPSDIAVATDLVNRSIPGRIVEQVRGRVPVGGTVAVLGLSYKPGSNVVEESQGIAIAKALATEGLRVFAFDPLAAAAARTELKGAVIVVDSVEECLRVSDAIIIANPDPSFLEIEVKHFASTPGVVIFDIWRILQQKLVNTPGVKYFPYGRGEENPENKSRLRDVWRQP